LEETNLATLLKSDEVEEEKRVNLVSETIEDLLRRFLPLMLSCNFAIALR